MFQEDLFYWCYAAVGKALNILYTLKKKKTLSVTMTLKNWTSIN